MARASRLADVGVALVATILSLLAAEGLLRLWRPQVLPSQEFIRSGVLRDMYVDDDKAGYRGAPLFSGRIAAGQQVTVFSTNSLGLRDEEPSADRGFRVAAFGDSVTWGWGVPQGREWISVAGGALAAEEGWQSINCGVCGYGTENASGLLERLAPVLQPDVVLLGFFPNDFVDNAYGQGAYEVRDGYLFDRVTHDYLRESPLSGRSHVWRLLTTAGRRLGWFKGGLREADRLQAYFLARDLSPQVLQHSVIRSERMIVRMRAIAAAAGARFAVVWLPMDWQVLEPGTDASLDRGLRERVEAAGIPSLDLLPLFRNQPDPGRLFLGSGDTHFSIRGHRVAGEAVATWLKDLRRDGGDGARTLRGL